MNEKTMIIPLVNNRDIKLRFVKVNGVQYISLASNEFLTDVEEFFKSGYYELDSNRQITIKTNE
jgi:hypothetical protein